MSIEIETSGMFFTPAGMKHRPFWSVMVPAYNPRADYLADTLRGVLQQAPGPEEMQIEVVNDCSPDIDVAAMVKNIAGARVVVSRTPRNQGLAGCWNACIERAQGEWIHILHQDDLVLPGFYEALRRGIQNNQQLGAAFCRHAFFAPDNPSKELSPLERAEPGVLADFIERLARGCVLQCPSIVVRRSVYEKLGGFNPALKYTLDWDMWLRLAEKYPVWYDPSVLACYRTHAGSQTARLIESGQNLREIRHLLEKAAGFQERQKAGKILSEAKTYNALTAVHAAESFLYRSQNRPQRNFKAAWNQLAGAVRLKLNLPVLLAIFGVGLRLMGAAVRSSRPARLK